MMTSNREQTRSLIGNLYAIFIGVLPLLMMYKLPFVNFGMGVLLALAFLPYVLSCVYNKKGQIITFRCFITIFFFSYYCYSVASDFNSLVLYAVSAVHIVMAPKSLYFDRLIRIVEKFALFSSVVLIFQFFLYSLFGIFIPFVWDAYVLDSLKGAGDLFEESSGFARMSGLFLEPSHYSKYALVALTFYLFENKINKRVLRNTIIITIGIICSTSGMGIVGAIGIWGYYIVMKDNYVLKSKSRLSKIIYLTLFGTILLSILYFGSTGFQHSISRIIGTSDDYNAIEGRTLYSEIYLTELNDTNLVFGNKYFELENYVVGYVKILVYSGVVGLALLIMSLVSFLPNNKTSVKINILMFIVLLFFSNIVGGLNLLFYYVIFNNKYIYEKNRLSVNL